MTAGLQCIYQQQGSVVRGKNVKGKGSANPWKVFRVDPR